MKCHSIKERNRASKSIDENCSKGSPHFVRCLYCVLILNVTADISHSIFTKRIKQLNIPEISRMLEGAKDLVQVFGSEIEYLLND